MREIKFRLRIGKATVGYEKWYAGKWSEERGHWLAKPCWLYSKDGSYWNPEPIYHELKDAFTGQCDKNGTPVFEGDWVACANGSMGVVEYLEKDMAFKFVTGKYDNEGGWSHPIEGFDGATLEVIGNIYEGRRDAK